MIVNGDKDLLSKSYLLKNTSHNHDSKPGLLGQTQ